MEDTESKYKILIDRLRDAKPDAGNTELLTDEIMKGISLQHKITTPHLLVWIRPALTAAAILLFGLFLYQQPEPPYINQANALTQFVKPSFSKETRCSSGSTLTLSENRKLLNQYICYMRSNMAENENSKQFYQKYLPKYRSAISK